MFLKFDIRFKRPTIIFMSEIDFPFYISLPLHFHFLVKMVTFYLYFLCTKLFGRSVSFLLFIKFLVLFHRFIYTISTSHLHILNKTVLMDQLLLYFQNGSTTTTKTLATNALFKVFGVPNKTSCKKIKYKFYT